MAPEHFPARHVPAQGRRMPVCAEKMRQNQGKGLAHAVRYLAFLGCVLALGGCIRSSEPLIDASGAHYPFKSMSLKDDNGQVLSIRRDGKVYRLLEEPGEPSPDARENKGSGLAYLFREIDKQHYLVQETGSGKTVNYGIAKREGDKLMVRSSCAGLSPDTLRAAGIQTAKPEPMSGEPDCHASSLAELIVLSKSPGIWSKETTTLQILSIE
jgi:hypothetical protein